MTANATTQFTVTFWGARGTLASPGREFARTGGNTACAEVRCGKRVIILDAGTGIRALGAALVEQTAVRKLDLLLTHAHYDHIEGAPFFAPFFSPEFSVAVYGGKLEGAKNTKEALTGLMRKPYFPVGPEVFSAKIGFHDIALNEVLDLGDQIMVRTAPLNHPGGATGYRIEYAGRSFAFITDTEHVPGKPDENVLSLIKGCDAFAYDASFSDAEYPEFAGYGHSTFEEGLRLRAMADARRMLAMHHVPYRSDDEVDLIEKAIRQNHPASGVAREGMVLEL